MKVFGIFLAIISLFVLLGGVVFTFESLKTGKQFREVKSWPTTQAVIATSRHDGSKIYLNYQFVLNGRNIKGSSYSTSNSEVTGQREQLKQLAATTYREGAMVTVYYNPETPVECYIVPGENAALKSSFMRTFLCYSIGLTMLALGIGLFFLGRHRANTRVSSGGGQGAMYHAIIWPVRLGACVLILILGYMILQQGIEDKEFAKEFKTWESTEGYFKSTHVSQSTSYRRKRGQVTTYYIKSQAFFELDGKTLQVNENFLKTSTESETKANQLAAERAAGAKVTVYYSPEKPGNNCIGEPGEGMLFQIIGYAIMLLAFILPFKIEFTI